MHGMIGRSEDRVHRVIRRNSDSTLKEHEAVVSHWPDTEAIMRRLPHRTIRAIQGFARRCNLTDERHIWTAAEDAKLRKLASAGYSRKEIASELGLAPGQVAGRLSYARISIARKPPAPSANPLVNAIRQRAYALNMTRIEWTAPLAAGRFSSNQPGSRRWHISMSSAR